VTALITTHSKIYTLETYALHSSISGRCVLDLSREALYTAQKKPRISQFRSFCCVQINWVITNSLAIWRGMPTASHAQW